MALLKGFLLQTDATALVLHHARDLHAGRIVSVVGTICLVAIVALLYRSIIHPHLLSPFRHIPYPQKNDFLTGNVLPFLREPWGFPLARWQECVPSHPSGFYRLILGPAEFLVPRSPAAIAAIVNKPYQFPMESSQRATFRWVLGAGLIWSDGDVHRKLRKMFNPLFSRDHVARQSAMVWDCAADLRDAMLRSTPPGGSAPADVYRLALTCFFDLSSRILCGKTGNDFYGADSYIPEASTGLLGVYDQSSLADSLVWNVVSSAVPLNVLFSLPLRNSRRASYGKRVVRDFCAEQVRRRRLDPDADDKDDILSMLLRNGVTDEDALVEHLRTLTPAGQETTANTLAWALLELARRPDVQDRLRREVRKTLASASPDAPPSQALVDSMPFLRCVLMEVLRLYPGFPLEIREASVDSALPGITIPAGTRIAVSPLAINRSTELWGPDAAEFRPERWEAAHAGGASSAYAFMTFSNGPRICIGKEYALLGLKMALAALVDVLGFEPMAGRRDPAVQKGTTLKPTADMQLMVSRVWGE